MGTMNLLSRIFTRSEPVLADVPLRSSGGQFTPSPKTRERMSRRASVNAQLACYVARTTRAEREFDTEMHRAVSRALAPKAGRG